MEKQRPLGIASLEDKIVQYALVKILNAVYENDFMGFSYGFRPGRSQHDALDALATGLVRTNVNWVLDADISQFFDRVSHEWLIRFTEHRIGDRRAIRLIRKWLKQPGRRRRVNGEQRRKAPHRVRSSHRCWQTYTSTTSSILWAHQWRRRYATGNAVMVRYADDIVIGFDKRYDARRFRYSHAAQTEGVRTHGSPGENPPDGVRRFAAETVPSGEKANQKRSTSWFTHISGKDRNGRFMLIRKTRRGIG